MGVSVEYKLNPWNRAARQSDFDAMRRLVGNSASDGTQLYICTFPLRNRRPQSLYTERKVPLSLAGNRTRLYDSSGRNPGVPHHITGWATGMLKPWRRRGSCSRCASDENHRMLIKAIWRDYEVRETVIWAQNLSMRINEGQVQCQCVWCLSVLINSCGSIF